MTKQFEGRRLLVTAAASGICRAVAQRLAGEGAALILVLVNLDGAFLALRAAMRAMRGRAGSIVLTASAAG